MEKCSVNDMIQKAKERYNVDLNYNRIARTIKRLGLWEEGKEVVIGKKKTRVFDSWVMEEVFMSPRLYNQLHENEPDFKSYKQLKKEAEQQRIHELEVLESYGNGEMEGDVDYNAIHRNIFEIKMNAIFEMFYSRFDEERYTYDYALVHSIQSPMDIDPQIVAANHRLKHPEDNYFKRKE